MQSAILDVPLSSKEMCNIIENDVWNGLGFSRPVSVVYQAGRPL